MFILDGKTWIFLFFVVLFSILLSIGAAYMILGMFYYKVKVNPLAMAAKTAYVGAGVN